LLRTGGLPCLSDRPDRLPDLRGAEVQAPGAVLQPVVIVIHKLAGRPR
jgi:hypothetical protein